MGADIREFKKTSKGKISKYISWTITFISLGITVYLGFIKKNEPKLEYDIVSSTTFINNNESAAYLKILIDTINVQESHLNISAFNIKVKNKGSENISYYNYDKGFFGLKLINGLLLEPPTLLEASNYHIKHYFSQNDIIKDNTMVEVPLMSLDKDEYYIMRVVLLHNADSIPSFEAEGKIIGQKEILVNNFNTPSTSFWIIAFGGNLLVQVVRFFAYLIGTILVVGLIVYIGDTIDTIKTKHKRKQIIKDIMGKKNILSFVKDDYINYGSIYIERARDIYSKTETDVTNKYKKSKSFINSSQAIETNNHEAYSMHLSRYRHISDLIDKGYLVLNDNDTIVFNKDAKRSVQTICSIIAAKETLE